MKVIKELLILLLIAMLLASVIGGYQLWRWYYFGYKTAVTDVVFHGKVIDQNAQPISGARVSYFIAGQLLAAGAGSGFTITDDRGMFKVQGEGAKIVIQAILGPHVDYNSPQQSPWIRHGVRTQRTQIETWEVHTADNPYIFQAWRVDEYEDVRRGGDPTSVLPDGRVYTYKPFEPERRNRWHDGETDGILRVSCERDAMAHGRDFQDWRITLAPIDGGIQKTDDIYMNVAPETGYQLSISVEQKRSSPDYNSSVGNQRYFFTAHNGKYFGNLFVHYDPHFRNDQCVVAITYRINMDGSRNLAAKPKPG